MGGRGPSTTVASPAKDKERKRRDPITIDNQEFYWAAGVGGMVNKGTLGSRKQRPMITVLQKA